MATRQYIGARYVPKIMGDWTANTLYEPLSIVTYNLASYTSKKIVPSNIGSPDQNPEYWACTGAYNAQITNLQNTVDGFIEDQTEKNGEIDLALSALDGRIDNIEDEIERNEYIIIGDST